MTRYCASSNWPFVMNQSHCCIRDPYAYLCSSVRQPSVHATHGASWRPCRSSWCEDRDEWLCAWGQPWWLHNKGTWNPDRSSMNSILGEHQQGDLKIKEEKKVDVRNDPCHDELSSKSSVIDETSLSPTIGTYQGTWWYPPNLENKSPSFGFLFHLEIRDSRKIINHLTNIVGSWPKGE